jgi:hypothetical protein
MEDKIINLLKYQIKLLHTIVTSMENYNHSFYSFIIDHRITENQTGIIMKALILLKDRLIAGKVSEEIENLVENSSEHLKILNKAAPPSFSDFKKFTQSLLGNEINPEYLLKSIYHQNIYKELCEYLLKDMLSDGH